MNSNHQISNSRIHEFTNSPTSPSTRGSPAADWKCQSRTGAVEVPPDVCEFRVEGPDARPLVRRCDHQIRVCEIGLVIVVFLQPSPDVSDRAAFFDGTHDGSCNALQPFDEDVPQPWAFQKVPRFCQNRQRDPQSPRVERTQLFERPRRKRVGPVAERHEHRGIRENQRARRFNRPFRRRDRRNAATWRRSVVSRLRRRIPAGAGYFSCSHCNRSAGAAGARS